MEKSQVKLRHIGFIVDGNRRFAREKNLPTIKGHEKGLEKVEMVIEELAKTRQIEFASFYLFSTENWNRTKDEVDYLMRLLTSKIKHFAQKMANNNIKCLVLGSTANVPEKVQACLNEAEEITKNSTGMTVCICFNYGGKLEISDAVNCAIKNGEKITPETIEKNLYHPEVPPCDMIVRTSGEERISGFMLWRAAYAEFLFIDKYWPALEATDIPEILTEYQTRNRRFGK